MLSNELFLRQSMELNVFFLRILKEHLIFTEASLTPKNANLARTINILKDEITKILSELVPLANSVISREVVNSGELVTNFTLSAEQATEYYTSIYIDSRLTVLQQSLTGTDKIVLNPVLLNYMDMTNKKIIKLLMTIIGLRTKMINDVLSCRMFTMSYPLLADHMLREETLYLNILTTLQRKEDYGQKDEAAYKEAFWNDIMGEHAKFIRGLLDPTEVVLIEKADEFSKIFDKLKKEAEEAQTKLQMLPSVTSKSLSETRKIRDFKYEGTKGMLECKVKSMMLPLQADHVLREANYYLRILKQL